MSSASAGAAAASTASSVRQTYQRNGCSSENLPPKALGRIAREIRDLHKGPPEGVRLVVDADTGVPGSLGEVLAELQGPSGTPYEGRYFQLKLVMSSDFPSSPPRGYFLTKIYHPNVDMSTGAICVNTLKKDWTANTTFSHVLSVVRCLLIVPFPESSLNDEAGKLFMESYDEYARRARLMADVHGRPRPFSDLDGRVSKSGLSESIGNQDVDEHNPSSQRQKLDKTLSSSSTLSTCSSSNVSKESGEQVDAENGSCSVKAGVVVRKSGALSDGALRVSGSNKSSNGDKKSKKKGLKRL